jgi:hypothetical protein
MSVKDFYRGAFAERELIIETVREHAKRNDFATPAGALNALAGELEQPLAAATTKWGDPLEPIRRREKRAFIAMLRRRASEDAAVAGALIALAEELESELTP